MADLSIDVTVDSLRISDSVLAGGLTSVRVSQVVAEVAVETDGIVRVSQLVVELANHATTAPQRVSQVASEIVTAGIAPQRVSQVVVETATPKIATQRVSQVALEVASGMPTAYFTLPRAKLGADTILAWVVITVEGVRYAWSGIALSDPITYADGYKEARLLLLDDLVLALSDNQGAIQASRATVEFSDLPDTLGNTLFRRWLKDGKRLRNADIEIKMISDHQRRMRYVPRTVFRGKIERYSGLSPFRGRFECASTLSMMLDRLIVTDVIGRHFIGCPEESRKYPLPILFGRMTDEGSTANRPLQMSEPARGVLSVTDAGPGAGYGISGYGDLPGQPATNLRLSEIVGGGTFTTRERWYVQIFSLKADGTYTNPLPFLNTMTIDIEAGSAISVEWDASPDPDVVAYRACIAWWHHTYGPYWQSYLETTGTSVIFTDAGTWDRTAFTPGAIAIDNAALYWNAWAAVMSDGLTAYSGSAMSNEMPFANRPHRVCVEPIPGALGYYLYSGWPTTAYIDGIYVATGGFGSRLFVPADQLNADGNVYVDYTWQMAWEQVVDNPTQGRIKPIQVGALVDRTGYSWPIAAVYAAHACSLTDPVGVYAVENEGTATQVVTNLTGSADVAVPGSANWTAAFGPDPYYTDALGTRWSLVALKGTEAAAVIAGTKVLRVNALGAESVGDGSGLLIVSLLDQLALLFDNLEPFASPPFLGGDWSTAPQTFDDGTPKRSISSFNQAAADAAIVMPEGLTGARWLSESISWRQLFSEVLRSGKLLAGVNAEGQLQVVFPNPYRTPTKIVSEVDEVLLDEFEFQDSDQGFANRIPYAYYALYDSPGSAPRLLNVTSVEDLDSQLAFSEVREASELSMPWLDSAVQARAVALLSLQESRILPRTVPLGSGIHWVMLNLGDLISLTHAQGPGYDDQVLMILGLRVSVQGLKVQATCIEPRIIGTDGSGNSVIPPGDVNLTEALCIRDSIAAEFYTVRELLCMSETVTARVLVTAEEHLGIEDSVTVLLMLSVGASKESLGISDGVQANIPFMDIHEHLHIAEIVSAVRT